MFQTLHILILLLSGQLQRYHHRESASKVQQHFVIGMIYKVLTQEEVEELSKQLESRLPGTAKIFYVVRSFLDGLLPGKEIIVDTWPEWSTTIIRTCNENEVQQFFRYTYMCHSKSPSALKYFLQRPGVVDWKKPARFTGIPQDVAPLISAMCLKHTGHVTRTEPRFMYAWTKKELPAEPEIPEGLHLSTLTIDDAATLRQVWDSTRKKDDLEGYFRTVLEHFDSSCLRDNDGNIHAYTCMQFNGSMAMLYVKPEHRAKGYFKIVLADLARRRLQKGEIAYGFVPTNDSNLVDQMRAMDFVWVPRGDVVWMDFEPLRINNVKNPNSMPISMPTNNKSAISRVGSDDVSNGADDFESRSLDCVVSNMAQNLSHPTQQDTCRHEAHAQILLNTNQSNSLPILSDVANIVGSS